MLRHWIKSLVPCFSWLLFTVNVSAGRAHGTVAINDT